MIKIISAKYEIIDATKLIEPYDERLDKETAQKNVSEGHAEFERSWVTDIRFHQSGQRLSARNFLV